MARWGRLGLWAQAALYVAAGVNHFWHSRVYVAIMPMHYEHPLGWVQFTGAAEMLGGMGLLAPQTRRVAAWGLIAMLVVYFDVHLSMVRHAERFAGIPVWVLWARLQLQGVLIGWAWMYTRPQRLAD